MEDTIAALKKFQIRPNDASLNFEKLRARKGYYSIRSNYSVRVLLRQTARDQYDLVAVGNHDFIYERHF